MVLRFFLPFFILSILGAVMGADRSKGQKRCKTLDRPSGLQQQGLDHSEEAADELTLRVGQEDCASVARGNNTSTGLRFVLDSALHHLFMIIAALIDFTANRGPIHSAQSIVLDGSLREVSQFVEVVPCAGDEELGRFPLLYGKATLTYPQIPTKIRFRTRSATGTRVAAISRRDLTYPTLRMHTCDLRSED